MGMRRRIGAKLITHEEAVRIAGLGRQSRVERWELSPDGLSYVKIIYQRITHMLPTKKTLGSRSR